MNYIGLDIHKGSTQVTVMDGDGGIVEKSRIKTEKEAIEDFFSDKEGR